MPDTKDYKDLLKQKHFIGEIEQGIRLANNEILHSQLPMLNKVKILSFAISVGKLRARYLEASLKLSVEDETHEPKPEDIEEIKKWRLLFEEARMAFDALIAAIERGYIDVDVLMDDDESS